MRNKTKRWIVMFFIPLLQFTFSDDGTNISPDVNNDGQKSYNNIYVPPIDYDWKPLGMGDPLQNDPTYDYVPPVLDRVQYWVEPSERKPDPPVPGEAQKTEILLLGVTSRKPAIPQLQADPRRDVYDPYMKYGSKYSQSANNRISRPSFLSSVPSPFVPSSFFPQNKNKFLDRTAFSKGTEQRVPYTMLVPPPYEPKLPNTPLPAVTQSSIIFPVSQFTTNNPSVTIQSSDLVYQHSSIANNSNNNPISSSISWEQHSIQANQPDFREELVYNAHLTPPDATIRLLFRPENFTLRPLLGADSSHSLNYVTPPTLKIPEKKVMYKAEVNNVDISNAYVKIGKTEAELQPTGIGLDDVPLPIVPSSLIIFPHSMKESKLPPLTMHKLHEMQTMHPPPVTMTPVFAKTTTNALAKLLNKERKNATTTTTTTTEIYTTEPEILTTTMTALTTDPMFKHYKQPKEPLKGPLYLIIQGHSKVKTYGPGKQMNGIPIQDTNEIPYHEDHFDLHEAKLSRKGRSGFGKIHTLKHVVQTRLGGLNLDTIEDRNATESYIQEANKNLS